MFEVPAKIMSTRACPWNIFQFQQNERGIVTEIQILLGQNNTTIPLLIHKEIKQQAKVINHFLKEKQIMFLFETKVCELEKGTLTSRVVEFVTKLVMQWFFDFC